MKSSSRGTGIVLNSQRIAIPGNENVTNYLDDPKLRLALSDMRPRNLHEQGWIHLVVVHTTGGIPGGSDLRPQVIKPGLGPSSGGGERIVASWTHDPARPGGAHIVVDFDGAVYCCADLVCDAAYHAEKANGCSVGIEVVQGHAEAELYQGQLDIAAKLALEICRLMPVPIQWQVPAGVGDSGYHGSPVKRFVDAQMGAGPYLEDVVGVVGHRDLTSKRGEGDPGDALMQSLVAAGCEAFDFAAGEDLAVWKKRQAALGIANPDGVPGPKTVQVLRQDLASPDGIWRLHRPQLA